MPKGRGRKGSKTPKRRLVTPIEHRAELTTVIPSQEEITTEDQTSPTLSTTRPSTTLVITIQCPTVCHTSSLVPCIGHILLRHSESTSYQATSVSAMVVRTSIKNLVLLMTFVYYHCSVACVQSSWPSFSPEDINCKLLAVHKHLLNFNIGLFIP